MSISLEALAMSGADYLDKCGIDMNEWENEEDSWVPPHLLAEEEDQVLYDKKEVLKLNKMVHKSSISFSLTDFGSSFWHSNKIHHQDAGTIGKLHEHWCTNHKYVRKPFELQIVLDDIAPSRGVQNNITHVPECIRPSLNW